MLADAAGMIRFFCYSAFLVTTMLHLAASGTHMLARRGHGSGLNGEHQNA